MCLLGTNCDMFQYTASSSRQCLFFPHLSLKDQNLFRTIVRDTTGGSSVYVLQCSAPYENVLKNNDPFTHSYDGKFSKEKKPLLKPFFMVNVPIMLSKNL